MHHSLSTPSTRLYFISQIGAVGVRKPVSKKLQQLFQMLMPQRPLYFLYYFQDFKAGKKTILKSSAGYAMLVT